MKTNDFYFNSYRELINDFEEIHNRLMAISRTHSEDLGILKNNFDPLITDHLKKGGANGEVIQEYTQFLKKYLQTSNELLEIISLSEKAMNKTIERNVDQTGQKPTWKSAGKDYPPDSL